MKLTKTPGSTARLQFESQRRSPIGQTVPANHRRGEDFRKHTSLPGTLLPPTVHICYCHRLWNHSVVFSLKKIVDMQTRDPPLYH